MNENEKMNKTAEKENGLTAMVFDVVSVLVTTFVAVAVVFIFGLRTIGVDGGSMNPTLNSGDRIIISAFEFTPEYGDIVVTCQPSKSPLIEDILIKRVIATEGQVVDIDFNTGVVYVDGKALDEPYTAEPTYDRESFIGPVEIPEGYVFVIGDNRNKSTDSRDYRVGLIKEEYIMGKAVLRTSPFTWLYNNIDE